MLKRILNYYLYILFINYVYSLLTFKIKLIKLFRITIKHIHSIKIPYVELALYCCICTYWTTAGLWYCSIRVPWFLYFFDLIKFCSFSFEFHCLKTKVNFLKKSIFVLAFGGDDMSTILNSWKVDGEWGLLWNRIKQYVISMIYLTRIKILN